jgi:preprotein translocase SecE subunit
MSDDDKPAKKTARIVRSPETFRERAIKAAAEADTPQREAIGSKIAGKVITPITSPTGKFFRRLFAVQPFKSMAWVVKIIGRILIPRYIRNSFKELKLVTWPGWRQSRQLTFAVLAFAIVFGTAVALVDYGLDKVFKQILLK